MSIEYRNAFLKNLMGKPLNTNERTALSGSAAVIPTETMNYIVERMKDTPILREITITYYDGGNIRIPVYSTNGEAQWTLTAEDSDDAMTYIELHPHQLIKTLEITADMQNMAIDEFEKWLVISMAHKMAQALEKAVFHGTGSDNHQPTGIFTTITTSAGTFGVRLTKADLLKIQGSLPEEHQSGAVWVMPSSVFYGEVADLPNFVDYKDLERGPEPRFLGHRVVFTDECKVSGVDQILYGDLSYYVMNFAKGVTIDFDDSVEFRSNSRVYRSVALADGALTITEPVVRFSRA